MPAVRLCEAWTGLNGQSMSIYRGPVAISWEHTGPVVAGVSISPLESSLPKSERTARGAGLYFFAIRSSTGRSLERHYNPPLISLTSALSGDISSLSKHHMDDTPLIRRHGFQHDRVPRASHLIGNTGRHRTQILLATLSITLGIYNDSLPITGLLADDEVDQQL